MKIRISPDVLKTFKNLKKRDNRLLTQVKKQLELFQINPKHKSLRLHKLSGKLQNRWSISISRNVRMVYVLLNKNEAYFISIGTHSEVYRR